MSKYLDASKAKAKLERLTSALRNGDIIERAGTDWVEQDWLPYAQSIVAFDTGELHDSLGGVAMPHGVRVFATAAHARAVDEGTSTHRAQPFMEPSVKATIKKLENRIQQEIRKQAK